ncbi:MAG TPA: hypothetical protein VM528_05945 [Burkholderiaceae bacterium]|jgi:hypothetical protein|nr:hypothetical protein [Burkholderiaceae bacterium]
MTTTTRVCTLALILAFSAAAAVAEPSAPVSSPAADGGRTPVVPDRLQVRQAVLGMAEPDLRSLFLACDRASRQSLLSLDEATVCVAASDVLVARSFGGDYGALLAWWRGAIAAAR